MAALATAGELRTRILVFEDPAVGRDKDGYDGGQPVNVFGAGQCRHCKWVNAHGREVYEAMQAGVEEPATLTMRYTPLVTPTCLIYKGADQRPYEVISVNDVEDRHIWLEVKVKRKVAAQ